MPKNRKILGIITVPLILVAMSALAPQCREHWALLSRYWSRTKPISFYGKVVDQSGNPIADAEVSIVINGFNLAALTGSKEYLKDQRVTCKSDTDGKFTVDHVSGTYLRIERIQATGYSNFPEPGFDRANLLGYGYSRDRGVPYYIPDPQKPAIVPLCKDGEKRLQWPSRGGKDEPNPW
jgi:hypothetical protein